MNACDAMTAVSEMTAVCAMPPTTRATIAGAEPVMPTPRPSKMITPATAANHGRQGQDKDREQPQHLPLCVGERVGRGRARRLHGDGGKQHGQPQRHGDRDDQRDDKNERGRP